MYNHKIVLEKIYARQSDIFFYSLPYYLNCLPLLKLMSKITDELHLNFKSHYKNILFYSSGSQKKFSFCDQCRGVLKRLLPVF